MLINGDGGCGRYVYVNLADRSHYTGTVATADGEVCASAEKYDPYLTIRRHMQHSDDDFSNVMWLHKVCMLMAAQ